MFIPALPLIWLEPYSALKYFVDLIVNPAPYVAEKVTLPLSLKSPAVLFEKL
jgi:hypothetical protein